MSKMMQYTFLLILVLILVAYWEGSKNVGSTLFSGVNSIINSLQGKNKDGNFSNYPQ